jgi:cardiolipin synthase (CMP-forming)
MTSLLIYLPNVITVTRLLLAVPISWALLAERPYIALILLGIAAITDWLDGWLARSYSGWMTEMGAFLDPLADKVLLISTFLTYGYLSQLPHWVVMIAVGRDITIMLGILIYRLGIGEIRYRPIFSSKLNTALQLSLVLLLLIRQIVWDVPMLLLEVLMVIMVIVSVISLAQYARLWIINIARYANLSR